MELKGWFFFCLRLSSWQKQSVGASAGMLQRFCRARDNPRPPPPPPPLLFSLEWCHSLGESDCYCQGDLCVLCALCKPNCAAQSKVRGQQSTNALSVRPELWNSRNDSRLLCHHIIIHFLCSNNAPHAYQPPSLPFVSGAFPSMHWPPFSVG